ncbi:MAG: SH3 domain-containing protein, partial [Deltaproteobacteria bacterium]|nr:SH3 domain-containing protein [Deltaproteobacteria bacterium]
MNNALKRFLWGTIIVGVFFCPISGHTAETGTPNAAPETKMNVSIVAETAQLREEPSVFATVLSKLEKGSVLLIKDKKGEWYSVQLQNGTSGWVHQ